MKRLATVFIVLAIIMTALSVAVMPSAADNTGRKKTLTFSEFMRLESENPPENGLYWNYFSALGSYEPMSYPTNTFLYNAGSRVYKLTIEDPLAIYHAFKESGFSSKEQQDYIDCWDRYKGDIDSYSVYQYYEVDTKAFGLQIEWLDVADFPDGDLTKERKKDGNYVCAASDLSGRVVYEYSIEGLRSVYWMYEGLLYQLSVEGGVPFGDEDIDLVRELNSVNYNSEALDILMRKLSGSAVLEMETGTEMPRPIGGGDQMQGPDDDDDEEDDDDDDAGITSPEVNDNESDDTIDNEFILSIFPGMTSTWLVIWAIVGVITLVGIVVIIVDIIRTRKRR